MLSWSELSPEQKCVLYAAATSALLQDLLRSWSPGSSWDDLMVHVPRLARAVVEMVQADLVEVYLAPSGEFEGALVFPEDVPDVINDPENWMTVDGPKNMVELGATQRASAVGIKPFSAT